MNVLVVDNYDSFTYNVVQYLGELGANVEVVRNDEYTVGSTAPDAVVISPGPGRPSEAGISMAMVEWCALTRTPLLGVCLGMQAIGEVYGARTVHAPSVMHGKTSMVHHSGAGLFRGLPNPFEAMRYHSLCLDNAGGGLEITAWTEDDVIMGIRHPELPLEGVQFHPESILTGGGKQLVANFLAIRRP